MISFFRSAVASCAFALVACGQSPDAEKLVSSFPAPEEGMKRYVLVLPEEADEAMLQVQLIIGKTVETDSVNRYFFAGELAQKTTPEQYPFFVLEKLGPMAGTLMAPPPGEEKVERFISLSGEPFLIPYQSSAPIVIYVPEDVEVMHRIWRGDDTSAAVPEK